jgi:N-methylhydantoinase A
MTGWQVGVDVGGTFTDILAVEADQQTFKVTKVPSTLGDQSLGVIAGLKALGLPLSEVSAFVHGTTVGTNAVLERKGARCGLITTMGFRDVLELGRRTRPHLYGLTGSFEAIIPRELRYEIPERTGAAGQVLVPLDDAAVLDAAKRLLAAGAEALVIHFLHSYANPGHELRAAEIVRSVWPNRFVTVGHEILREMREFERGSTAAVNAYIQPLMWRYLSRLADELKTNGMARALLVMQGNAGTMTATAAADQAVQTVMSGPAAGALAAARIGNEAGFRNLVACDMGGTSFDVSLIKGGEPALSAEKDVAYGVPVRVPMIDIHTIGAGGGSIARIDKAGLLRIGPESAGSWPGPICYGRGGTEPTVTDANLVLGRLDPHAMPGVETPVPVPEVREIIQRKIGEPLGLDGDAAAAAILAVAINHLAGAIRLVSIERGEDPRDYALFAFGGAGALHATALAIELGIPKVLVPRFPGATSALGCILADLRHDFVRTIGKPLLDCDGAAIDSIFAEQRIEGERLIAEDGVLVDDVVVQHEADLLFHGQSHVFRIPVDSPGFDPEGVLARFHAHYRSRFDIDLGEMRAMLTNLRTTVLGTRRTISAATFAPQAGSGEPATARERRPVRFGDRLWDTPILRRERFTAGQHIAGPAIIEQMDATTVLDPGTSLLVDPNGNLIITVGDAA